MRIRTGVRDNDCKFRYTPPGHLLATEVATQHRYGRHIWTSDILPANVVILGRNNSILSRYRPPADRLRTGFGASGRLDRDWSHHWPTLVALMCNKPASSLGQTPTNLRGLSPSG